MTLDDVRTLFAYDRWATAQLLDAARPLAPDLVSRPVGGSVGSLLGITTHMVGASWLWLERFHGRSPASVEGIDALTSIAAVRARTESVADGLQAYVAGLDPGALGTSVSYTSLKGDPFTMPLAELLLHVTNHGTYHRGQISMALRLLGAEAVPSTDFVIFQRLPR
jgi:uncharacterized damage-inducible protein DinB